MGDPTAEASIDIQAPADEIWAIVADVTRTPEWSPVCRRCDWLDEPGTAEVGARFRGYNRLNGVRWSRAGEVTHAEPGRLFAFSTEFRGRESTRWRYRFEPVGSATRVREAYEVVTFPPWIRTLRRLPGVKAKSDRDTRWNLATSLERLKAIAESTR